MDTITHIMIAFCFYLFFGYNLKERRMPLIPLMIGAAVPDFDYFFNLINCQIFWLRHRAMFHSIVGIIPILLVLSLFLTIPKIKKFLVIKDNFPIIFLLMFLGFLIHLLFDIAGGIMLLFPFSFEMYGTENPSTIPIYSIVFCIILISLIIKIRKEVYTQKPIVLLLAGLSLLALFVMTLIWSISIYDGLTLATVLFVSSFNFVFLEAFLLRNSVKRTII